MSYKLLIVVIFSFVMYSCEKNGSSIKPETYTFEFSALSKIETTIDTFINDYTWQDSLYIDTIIMANSYVVAGDNYVFKYIHTYADNLLWVDDEYTERILIEIPATQGDFMYEGEDLHMLNTAFEYYCYCPSLGLIKADSGSIAGFKINDSNWRIELNARFRGIQDGLPTDFLKEIEFSATFKEKL